MYKDDDILSRRDRAAEDLLKQMLESNGGCGHENGCSQSDDSYGHFEHGEGMARYEDAHTSWGLHDHPLAMVYSPIQKWRNIYDGETALVRGTIFEELDLPFLGKCYCEKDNGCVNDGPYCNNRCGGEKNG